MSAIDTSGIIATIVAPPGVNSGAQLGSDLAAIKAQLLVAYNEITAIENALVVGEGESALLSESQSIALSLANAPGENNPFATMLDVTYTIDVSSTGGAITIDMDSRRDVYARLVLTENISTVSITNPPSTDKCSLSILITHGSGGPFNIPITAWAGTTVAFRGEYLINQDEVPTFIHILSFDAMVSALGFIDVRPESVDTITVGSDRDLLVTDEQRHLFCTAAMTLTATTATTWIPHAATRIEADGGDVTIAGTGVTINSLDGKRVIPRYTIAVLKAAAAANTFTLSGTLKA
jgi:hypothetical protein